MGNIRLIKILLNKIISLDSINIYEMANIIGSMKQIVCLFQSMVIETYFNLHLELDDKFTNDSFAFECLIKFALKGINDNEKENKYEWLTIYFDEFLKLNTKNFERMAFFQIFMKFLNQIMKKQY